MRVSVVICTYNRGPSLRETLRALRHQRYADFEVVVVNGPSTDDTETVLAEFDGAIRTASCPVANLSVSRNIGIRAAAGEIVAFIDDDALPEFDWLNQALPAFSDPEVAGVGGIVFDHTGMDLQYRYSAANRLGEATKRSAAPFDDLCAPGSFLFPYLQGTNALFRRRALEEIGGFDETYEYYLDETDVCCRLIDAGFLLRQLPNAPVHHKCLPSGVRSADRVTTNWYPMIKNLTYFGYRHALGSVGEDEIIRHSERFVEQCVLDAESHERASRLPAGAAQNVRRVGAEALARGIELGRQRHDLRMPPLPPADSSQFRPYEVIDRSQGRRVVIISGDYPPRMTGGIARFIGDVAPRLAAAGHEVRVITRSPAHGMVDLEDGVWVHRIEAPPLASGRGVVPEATPSMNAFATAAMSEVRRIAEWTRIDVVYGPAWDVEVIGALRGTPLPVVTMLATPLLVAGTHAGLFSAEPDRGQLAGVIAAERELFTTSDLVHCISAAIRSTIEHEYQLSLAPGRSPVAPIGLVDRALEHAVPKSPDHRVTVLFVGRLEARKGIDDLIAAIEQLGPTAPDVDWVIAGREVSSPGVEAAFRARSRGVPWTSAVRFVGDLTDDELVDWYRRADLVVLPSRYESFGLVMVEAMMHCRAQVTCDVGGITEVVTEHEAALVPPAEPSALAAAIQSLLHDPAARQAMALSGRQRFEAQFEIGVAADRLSALLARVRLWPVDSPRVHLPQLPLRRQVIDGFEAVSLASEQALEVVAPLGERCALAVHCDGPATMQIMCGDDSRLQPLTPGWARVEVASSDLPLAISVVDGSIAIAGVLAVRDG